VLKDMRLITGEADALGASLMTSDAVRDQVAAACAAGFGASDMSALGRFLRDEEAQ